MLTVSLLLQANSGTTPDILDSLIYATIVLFILSIITEKLTQLVRFYPRTFRWIGIVCCTAFYFPIFRAIAHDPRLSGFSIVLLLIVNTFLLVVLVVNDPIVADSNNLIARFLFKNLEIFKNIRKAKDGNTIYHEVNKTDKEKELTAMSFIVGFLVAYCFNANLFNLFKPALELGWGTTAPFVEEPWYALNPEYFDTGVAAGIGFVLTAFFLAFGSKFFHDLLDTLLQIKDLKRKLNDKETFDIETVGELKEQLKYTQGELVRKAIAENKASLEILPNFLSLHEGLDIQTDTKMAYLNLTDNNIEGLPNALPYTLSDNKRRTVPLKIIPNVKIAQVALGKIFNENNVNYIGSIGLPLILDNELWLLTCDHVLTGGSFDSQTQQGLLKSPGKAKFSLDNVEHSGVWSYGYQDKEFDIALVKPDDPKRILPSGFLSDPLEISRQLTRVMVSFKGAVSTGEGFVFAQEVEEPVKFANQTIRMKGLMKISASGRMGAISKSGDSGSALFTPDKRAVAIIIASNDLFTYAMSLEKIFSGWDAKIH